MLFVHSSASEIENLEDETLAVYFEFVFEKIRTEKITIIMTPIVDEEPRFQN